MVYDLLAGLWICVAGVVWWLRFRLLVGFGTLWLRAFHWWVLLVDLWVCVVGYCGRRLFGWCFCWLGWRFGGWVG